MNNKNIITIGGGNGQSFLLNILSENFSDKNISSIVSMSDDGRTTGELMRLFLNQLDTHLPPPGDLRRCLFSLSNSKFKNNFKELFEYTFKNNENFLISDFKIRDLFNLANKEIGFLEKKNIIDNDLSIFIENSLGQEILDFRLPLNSNLKGHKFGNILMASIYYNLEKNYTKMLDKMHDLMELDNSSKKVIPVTNDKARIKAILENGEIIETQDNISNVANYSSPISKIDFMEDSKNASINKDAEKAILTADKIIIGPGDLYTSICVNTLPKGFKESIENSKGEIIFILNSVNKTGETTGFNSIDFIEKIEKYFGKKIDFIIANNKKPNLNLEEENSFKNDISVKGGNFIIPTEEEKIKIEKGGRTYIGENLIKDANYRFNKKEIINILKNIL